MFGLQVSLLVNASDDTDVAVTQRGPVSTVCPHVMKHVKIGRDVKLRCGCGGQ